MTKKLLVFISSRMEEGGELEEERAAAIKTIGYIRITKPVTFEGASATPETPKKISLDLVKECDMFVQILDKTITPIIKEEYETALEHNRRPLLFVKKGVERDQELADYIDKIKRTVKYNEFVTLKDFKKFVREAVKDEIITGFRTYLKYSEINLIKKIEKYRKDRLEKIRVNEIFQDKAKTVFHLIPIVSCDSAQKFDLDKIKSNNAIRKRIGQIYGWQDKWDVNSYLITDTFDGEQESCVQFFENGIIEVVNVESLKQVEPNRGMGISEKTIDIDSYENFLINSLNIFLDALKELGVNSPMYLFLTLLEIKGSSIHSFSRRYIYKKHRFTKDDLGLEKIYIKGYDDSPEHILKPTINSIWRAFGINTK